MSGLSFRIRSSIARFMRARRGATAVEFAIIALPFFSLIFGIIELGMFYMVSTTLENATANAARRIRTGEKTLQTGLTTAAFKNNICANLGWLQADCTANLDVDVRVYNSFGATNGVADPITSTTTTVAGKTTTTTAMDPTKETFCTGNPGQIVLVRAYYQWKLLTPGISQAMQRLSGGKTLITATTVFINEPYEQATPVVCP